MYVSFQLKLPRERNMIESRTVGMLSASMISKQAGHHPEVTSIRLNARMNHPLSADHIEMQLLARLVCEDIDKKSLCLLEAARDGAIMAGPVGAPPPMLDSGVAPPPRGGTPHPRAKGMFVLRQGRWRGKRRSQLVTKRIITGSPRGQKPCVSGRWRKMKILLDSSVHFEDHKNIFSRVEDRRGCRRAT